MPQTTETVPAVAPARKAVILQRLVSGFPIGGVIGITGLAVYSALARDGPDAGDAAAAKRSPLVGDAHVARTTHAATAAALESGAKDLARSAASTLHKFKPFAGAGGASSTPDISPVAFVLVALIACAIAAATSWIVLRMRPKRSAPVNYDVLAANLASFSRSTPFNHTSILKMQQFQQWHFDLIEQELRCLRTNLESLRSDMRISRRQSHESSRAAIAAVSSANAANAVSVASSGHAHRMTVMRRAGGPNVLSPAFRPMSTQIELSSPLGDEIASTSSAAPAVPIENAHCTPPETVSARAAPLQETPTNGPMVKHMHPAADKADTLGPQPAALPAPVSSPDVQGTAQVTDHVPTREEMLAKLIEGVVKKYRRLFIAGRGWLSLGAVQRELGITPEQLSAMAAIFSHVENDHTPHALSEAPTITVEELLVRPQGAEC